MPSYEGRLELTWTNKHLRLLAHDDGTYEWLEPSDYRVAEVRLLRDETKAGATAARRCGDNLLIEGDALHGLTSLRSLPEFAPEFVGQVKLAYIDPPFNTQQTFLQYDDALEHSVWLTMLRDRLQQIHELLAAEGTVWLHLDDAEAHRARAVLDEVFGAANFIATVIWEKTTSGRNDAHFFSTDHDYILVYAKDALSCELNQTPRDVSEDRAYKNPDNDARGPWREIDYKGPKSADERPNLYYPVKHPNGEDVWPRKERVWAFGPEQHAEHVKDDLLYWGRTNNYRFPKLKKFLSSARTTSVPRTLWSAEETDTTRRAKDEIKRLFPGMVPFATPKPEKLLAKIIHLGSLPGDLVLDCFVGSGTTAAVAQKMGRRWVAVERSSETVKTFTKPRLDAVIAGSDPGGITGDVEWAGGGGYRHVKVTPSMFEADEGLVFLAEGMTNGRLAEATAGQLGFDYSAKQPPFAGTKGRSRLAVVDGVVNEGVVRLLADALAEGEQVVVCGTAIDQQARTLLRTLRPGSTVRKIPAALLSSYRYREPAVTTADAVEAQA